MRIIYRIFIAITFYFHYGRYNTRNPHKKNTLFYCQALNKSKFSFSMGMLFCIRWTLHYCRLSLPSLGAGTCRDRPIQMSVWRAPPFPAYASLSPLHRYWNVTRHTKQSISYLYTLPKIVEAIDLSIRWLCIIFQWHFGLLFTVKFYLH